MQGGHSFEPIYWPFVGGLVVGTVSNLHLDTGLLQFIQLTQAPAKGSASLLPVVEGVGYQEVKKVCDGVAVLNPEYQDAHNQENQSYVGTSCGFGLTYQSKIRKVWGYRHYLCTLGRGSNLLLPLGLPPKLKAEETAMGQHHLSMDWRGGP